MQRYITLWLLPVVVSSYVAVIPTATNRLKTRSSIGTTSQLFASSLRVQLDATLTDEKITALFAWISRAFHDDGDERYNNLMLAIAAVFGNLPPDSPPVLMLQEALEQLPGLLKNSTTTGSETTDIENMRTGAPFSRYERESASMGAMGAAQWTGEWRTRPHALLCLKRQKDNKNNQDEQWTCVDDWVRSLPRGCRRTIKRALEQNFTVVAHPIVPNAPAPHSSLAHFRCVVEHEVRLLSSKVNDDDSDSYFGYNPINTFINALAEAVSRYMGTTQMTGEIREYRDCDTGRVIAFAHEIRKGRTIRGQWFYATDDAAKRYVWFHSVYSLVQRAIECPDRTIDAVDLGPSGSDEFSELKARYGFVSVDDWPKVANYRGPFWDYETNAPAKKGMTW